MFPQTYRTHQGVCNTIVAKQLAKHNFARLGKHNCIETTKVANFVDIANDKAIVQQSNKPAPP